MTLFLGILMCCGAVLIAWYYWQSVAQEASKSFYVWVFQGLIVPCAFWLAINGGLFWSFGPFMPQVSTASNAGELLRFYAGTGLIIVSTYWLAISLGWLLALIAQHVEPQNRRDLAVYALIWSGLLFPVSACAVLAVGWNAAGIALGLPLAAIVHSAVSLVRRPKIAGTYSAALGKLKFGRAREAEWEILNQLEEAEDDFAGWMLLAEIYATQFKDLQAADQTVRDLCAQPGLNGGQVVTALHRLADWHLQIGENPPAARETLEIICKAYAGTHLAHMAQLRINRLPASRKDLVEQRQVRTLRLPGASEKPESAPASDPSGATAMANALVAKLNVDPDDVPRREQLALVFADGLGRYDLGIEQIELLLAIPDVPEEKRPQWLSQLASWQFKLERDSEIGRRTLHRLIEEYPQSAEAFAAQRRLLLMDAERKIRRAQAATL